MAPSVIVALCLLALASAAPQKVQDLQCATSCDPTIQPHVWGVGKTYSFDYNVMSSVKLVGVKEGITQAGFTGKVDVSRINHCELAVKFTSSNEEVKKVNKYPLVVSIIGDGKFEKVCGHPEDDSESINIKKGIASVIQYSLPSFTSIKRHIVAERSVLGTCPTAYSIKNNGQNWVVNKEIVHSECQDHVYSHSEIPSILSKSPMPIQVSKSVCTQVFSETKVPQTITCKDTKVVRPAYGAYKFIEATQESTLQFTSESTDMSVLNSIKGTQLLSKKLSYDHSMPAKNPALVEKLDAVLSNVCEMVQGQGHRETASVVNKAIDLLKHIPDDAFVTVLNKIRAGGYCADYSKLEALFMDAIAFIGEPGALKVIAQEVSAGRATGGRTALYTAALHLLSKPTVKHVAALTPIVAMENPSSTIILAAASVVNKHCKLYVCENIPAVKNILNLLTDKLVNQCTPAFSKSNPITVITTLKTLGNIGYLASEHAEKVIQCAKTEGVETNVRFAATMVLKGTPCKAHVKSALQAIALDQGMDTEVRIGSYLAAIKCADEGDLQNIIEMITADSNKQVRSFVLSHLHNLKETKWPLKAHLQKLLHNMEITTNYESNIFKYSRNIEMSYNTRALGVGAAVDSNVVFTPESYIPRLVNLGLDMNLLGSFVNIGEVGARVEGFDPIMKEVFGPESYLHKTPLSEMFKDTSLFIKQHGDNIFRELEKLIRENKSTDIKSLIKSVSKFLKASNINLPKMDLYAKLMGQEYAFLSLAGPMQEVNINRVIETITSAVVEALVAAKDVNINTVRAAHLHVDYAIPTIQGIPLKIKLESTAVTGMHVQSKLDSKSKSHDALLKFIPSLSIAIDGHIGYGAIMRHGLKMKNAIYSTNGLCLFVSLKNGQELEWKLELPEKMELINVKSEFYQVTANNLMDEKKIYPSNIKDARIAQEQCFAIAESMTGLRICFNMNIPHVLNSDSMPLGMPAQLNIYLQKSDAQMKGYIVTASLKNKANKKALKMVAGTYGSASSTESSVALTYTKKDNIHQAAAEIKSLWFTTACKFDVKKEAIENGNEYQVTGFAGLTDKLTETHKFLSVWMRHANNADFTNADLILNVEKSVLPLTIGFGMDIPFKAPWFTVIRKIELKVAVDKYSVEGIVRRKIPGQYHNTFTIQRAGSNVIWLQATHTVTGNALTNFNFITEASTKLANKEIGTTFTFKHEKDVIDTIWEIRNAGVKVFRINVNHIMKINLYTTTLQIELPTLPKTIKFSNVLNVVEFLSYKIMTDVHMNDTPHLHIEGPISVYFSKTMIKKNIDLNISSTFGGKIKFTNAALLSRDKIQYTLDMRHSATPITIIDIIIDRTNAAETTAKAIIHIPVLVKAECGAAVTSDLVHTSMNIFILPTTPLARRFKGYADLNLADQKLKTDIFWDAEKDPSKKISLVTEFKSDSSLGKVWVQGDLAVTSLIYGFKVEAMVASPFKWFLGTTGLELALTAPSNKVIVAKTFCTVEHAETLVIFKPLVALHTFDQNKYEIAGSFAIKKLPTIWNFDISSEFTIIIPQIEKITVATKFLHEYRNDGLLSHKIMTNVHMGNTALLHIDGPVSLQFSKTMIKHNIDIKISGAFVGTIKVMNVALLSLEKIQYTLDMKHSATPITMIDIIIDRTNAVKTTAKAIIHVPVLVKAEYVAVVTSGMIHTTINTHVLPMDKTAVVRIEGPVSLEFSKTMIKHNIDIKISGELVGTIKVMNAALLSLENIQYTLDMRHSTTPITKIDIIIDRTNEAETTAKAIIHIPILVKAKCGAVVTSGLLHTTMNTFILPTTSMARRFKGNADLNLTDQKVKIDFFWDAENDPTRKIALITRVKMDSSWRKVLVQGDLAVTSLIYGFKVEAMMASPFKWFLGTTGLELALTAPSNKVMVVKALYTVEHEESLVIFKPLVALHTLNENKYEIAGSFSIKKLPAILSFDISSELTINIPQIQKITVATKFVHEDRDGACAIVFKTGIKGLKRPIALEIVHGASEDKYTTLFKVQHGSIVGSVATNVALISGFKAFDITVDASLPFAVVKALTMRAVKTAEGKVTWIFTKNQVILAKVHYLMTSWTAHTFSLECPSRTIEFFMSFSGNEMTMKVFPEKNLSPKMLKTIIRVTNKVGSAHIECFVTAPSLPNEMRIAAEFSLADPTHERIVNVDIHFPKSEFKSLVNEILEELNKLHRDLVKDGLFPEMTVVYKELKLALADLLKYLNTIKIQITKWLKLALKELPKYLNTLKKILTRYWNIMKNWSMWIWKNYGTNVIALMEAARTEVLRYWKTLKIKVPILYNDFLAMIKNTELWKMLHGMVNQIIERYPALKMQVHKILTGVMNWAMAMRKDWEADVITLIKAAHAEVLRYWKILRINVPILLNDVLAIMKKAQMWAMRMWKNYEADVIALVKAAKTGVLDCWEILKINIPIVYNDIMEIMMKTEIWKMLQGMLNQIIEQYPDQYNILLDFYNKVIWTTVTEIRALTNKIMAIPSLRFEELWKILNELPTIFANLRKQLLDTELMAVIIPKYLNILKIQVTEILTIVKKLAMRMWKNNEANVVALMKAAHAEVLRYWEILKIRVPILNNVHAAMVDIWARVIKPVYADLVNIFWKLMNINFTNISQLIDQLWQEIPAFINVQYNTLVDFYNKVIWTAFTEIKEFINKIIALPYLRLEEVWKLLKNELPTIFDNLRKQLLDTELMTAIIPKCLNILNMHFSKILTSVNTWVMRMWKVYEADVIALIIAAHTEVLRYWEMLRIEVPILNDVHAAVLTIWARVIKPVYTEIHYILWKLMNINFTNMSQLIEHLLKEIPAFINVQYNILIDFYNKVILTTVTEIKKITNKIMDLPSFRIEMLWKLLKGDLPTIFANLRKQLLNTELVNVIIKNINDMEVQFPIVHAAMIEIWARVIKPVQTNLVPIFWNIMNINFTNMLQLIERLWKEIPVFINAQINILLDLYNKVILTTVNEIRVLTNKIMDLPAFRFEPLWNLLKDELPTIFVNLRKQLLNTNLITIIIMKINDMKEQFPIVHAAIVEIWARVIKPVCTDLVTISWKLMNIIFTNMSQLIDQLWKEIPVFIWNEIPVILNVQYNILLDFYNKVILTTVAEIDVFINKIIDLPSFRFEPLWKLLKNELPTIFANPRKQLLDTKLMTTIVEKVNLIEVHFPAVHAAMVDIWAHVIKPVYTDLVTIFWKLMNINFTNISQLIDHLVKEMPAFFNKIVRHLMDAEVVRMFITIVKEFMEANPMIKSLYEAVIGFGHNIMITLWGDFVMIYEKLMINKIVELVQDIINMKEFSVEFVTNTGHRIVTEVLGATYTITGDHISAVVILPVSVSTLRPMWNAVTVRIPAFVAEIMNSLPAIIKNIHVWVTTIREQVFVFVKVAADQIPVIVRVVETHVPNLINKLVSVLNNFIENIPDLVKTMKEQITVFVKFVADQIPVINELIAVLNNVIEFVMNTKVAKFLMVKIEEVIRMYPAMMEKVTVFVEFVANQIQVIVRTVETYVPRFISELVPLINKLIENIPVFANAMKEQIIVFVKLVADQIPVIVRTVETHFPKSINELVVLLKNFIEHIPVLVTKMKEQVTVLVKIVADQIPVIIRTIKTHVPKLINELVAVLKNFIKNIPVWVTTMKERVTVFIKLVADQIPVIVRAVETHVPKFINELLALLKNFIKNIPVLVKTMKEELTDFVKVVVDQIPVIVKIVETHVPKFINGLVAVLNNFVKNIPVLNNFIESLMNTEVAKFLMAKIDEVIRMYPAMKEQVTVFVKVVADRILVIVGMIDTHVTKLINELVVVLKNFIDWLMNTEVVKFLMAKTKEVIRMYPVMKEKVTVVVKFVADKISVIANSLMAKIEEVIKMFPAYFNAINEYFEWFVKFAIEHFTLAITKIMEVPIIRRIVEYIWDLIFNKETVTSLLSSWNSVSSSVSSYSSTVINNMPSFIKLHTPSVATYWMSYLIQ